MRAARELARLLAPENLVGISDNVYICRENRPAVWGKKTNANSLAIIPASTDSPHTVKHARYRTPSDEFRI